MEIVIWKGSGAGTAAICAMREVATAEKNMLSLMLNGEACFGFQKTCLFTVESRIGSLEPLRS